MHCEVHNQESARRTSEHSVQRMAWVKKEGRYPTDGVRGAAIQARGSEPSLWIVTGFGVHHMTHRAEDEQSCLPRTAQSLMPIQPVTKWVICFGKRGMKSNDKTKADQGQICPRRWGHADLLGRRVCSDRTWYCKANIKALFTIPQKQLLWGFTIHLIGMAHGLSLEEASARHFTHHFISPYAALWAQPDRKRDGQKDGVSHPSTYN